MQRKRQKTEQDLADIVYQMQKENLRDYRRILDNYLKVEPIAPTLPVVMEGPVDPLNMGNLGYPLPTDFDNTDLSRLTKRNQEIRNDIKKFNRTLGGLKRKKK